jgi:hypothetical protein
MRTNLQMVGFIRRKNKPADKLFLFRLAIAVTRPAPVRGVAGRGAERAASSGLSRK